MSAEQWRSLVAKYFPADMVDKALYVIEHESGGNQNAAGDNGKSIGLFQIQSNERFSTRPSKEWLSNPENNIRYAAQTLGAAKGNWKPWGEGATYQGKAFGSLGNNPYKAGSYTAQSAESVASANSAYGSYQPVGELGLPGLGSLSDPHIYESQTQQTAFPSFDDYSQTFDQNQMSNFGPSYYGAKTTGLPEQRGSAPYGFQPEMWQALQAANGAMKAAGLGQFSITDGWRSLAAQQRLKHEKPNLAATPGRSVHGLGLAADLGLTSAQQRWLEQNGARYGLARLPSESWHWQYVGQRKNLTPQGKPRSSTISHGGVTTIKPNYLA